MDTAARRAHLLEHARELFEARSYDDVSIDDLCAAAGVSKGLLYHYFEGKHGLYVDVVRAGAAELLEAVLAITTLDIDPALRMERALDGWLVFAQAHPRTFVSAVRGGVGVDAQVVSIVDELHDTFVQLLAFGLGREIDDREQLALRGWVGFVESITIAWLVAPTAAASDEVRAACITAFPLERA
ncbi:MAG: hypothetical protein JWM86_2525 [Thermoleophilia bacterium]|nr:hypothetical protein [Thermoleophilia bacterium]